jgi:hypothetical protein
MPIHYVFRYVLCLWLSWFANGVNAQTLEGVDNDYDIPFGRALQVETYGVLENDSLDDESAGESGATAELINSPGHGTLSCSANTGLELCADGSFDYAPGVGFNGIDSFTYQAVFGNAVSAIVTVNLTACNGGPQIFDCWKEVAYLRKLAKHGYGVFYEGFESTAWDVARPPVTVPSVTTQDITWTSNHPDTNNITTGSGPARTGNWGAFDSNHGVATGVSGNCDIDNPAGRRSIAWRECLYYWYLWR